MKKIVLMIALFPIVVVFGCGKEKEVNLQTPHNHDSVANTKKSREAFEINPRPVTMSSAKDSIVVSIPRNNKGHIFAYPFAEQGRNQKRYLIFVSKDGVPIEQSPYRTDSMSNVAFLSYNTNDTTNYITIHGPSAQDVKNEFVYNIKVRNFDTLGFDKTNFPDVKYNHGIGFLSHFSFQNTLLINQVTDGVVIILMNDLLP